MDKKQEPGLEWGKLPIPGFGTPLNEVFSLFGLVISQSAHQSMRDWLKQERAWVGGVLLICLENTLVHIGVTQIDPAKLPASLGDQKSVLFLGIDVAITVMLGVSILRPGAKPARKPQRHLAAEGMLPRQLRNLARAREASARAMRPWPWLWFAWFVLYLVLWVSGDARSSAGWALNLLNNLTAVALWAMFVEMDSETLPDISGDGGPHSDGYTDEGQPTQNNRAIWLIALAVCLLAAGAEFVLQRANYHQFDLLLATLSGMFCGVITGLLTARLTSKTLDVPKLWILFLMLYAVIQPLFPLLTSKASPGRVDAWLTVVLTVYALFGKAILLFVVHWLDKTERLTYYMLRAIEFNRDEPSGFQFFLKTTTEWKPESAPPALPDAGTGPKLTGGSQGEAA